MTMNPRTPEAIKLLHEGCIALAAASRAGIGVDMEYCQNKFDHLGRQVTYYRKKLEKTSLIKEWRRAYPDTFNWESNEQLGDVVYNILGHEAKTLTEKGNPSTSQGSLEALGLPEIEDLVKMNRLLKARNTFLAGIMRETIQTPDGLWRLHPFFHLTRVTTFRSSSSDINFQNLPKRVKEIMKIVRRAFIPRPGYQLAEIDFSGAEIRGAYCYHKDPEMLQELINPERDMHRDMAMECFKLTHEQMGHKGEAGYATRRHCGKNKFVFPSFYGDYHVSIAGALWDEIDLLHLTTADGTPMRDHLRSVGLGTYKKFEKHLKKVEDLFWNKRFPTYNKWRETWVKKYHKKGYVDTLTGFRCSGYMRRNQVINFPVQGVSFHMLLWSLIRLHQIMTRKRYRSRIIGQIHDSIVLELHPDETVEILQLAHHIMTVQLPKAWKWIKCPMEADADLAPIDGSWNTMKGFEIPAA